MRRKSNAIKILCLLSVVIFITTACQSATLTVTFDAGEYGSVAGQAVQTVDSKFDIIFPEIEVEDGYIFVGYNKTNGNLPSRGNIVVDAEYVKYETWFVDAATHERLDGGYQHQVLIGEPSPLPHVEVLFTDMQSGDTDTQFVKLVCDKSSVRHSAEFSWFKLIFTIYGNEDFSISVEDDELQLYASEYDSSSVLKIDVVHEYYTEQSLLTSLSLPVFIDHNRVVEMTIIERFTQPKGGSWYDEGSRSVVQAGDKVAFNGTVVYQVGSGGSRSFTREMVYIVERIWSIHGDEVATENFDSYAYFVPYYISSTGNANRPYLQLTELLGNGWRVEVYVYHIIDEVRSETYTLYIS